MESNSIFKWVALLKAGYKIRLKAADADILQDYIDTADPLQLITYSENGCTTLYKAC